MTMTALAGRIVLPDDSQAGSGRLYFTTASWDMGTSLVFAPGPTEIVLDVDGNYDFELQSTTNLQRNVGYSVDIHYYSTVTRKTVVSNLGVIGVPSAGGPYTLPDLLALPFESPVPADILAQCAAYAALCEAAAELAQQVLDITQHTITRFSYTATAAQTTFSGPDTSAQTLSYVPGNEVVFLNGVYLARAEDYTATSGSSVVLASGAMSGDELRVFSFAPVSSLDVDAMNEALAASSGMVFATKADMLADLSLTYSVDTHQVIAGDYLTTLEDNARWKVAASGATNHDEVTAGGVKLYEMTTVFHIKNGETLEIIGNGDNGTPLSLSSGETYNNGSGIVPKVPITGLFNIENGEMAFWPDLDGDGDYDADIWFKDNGYIAATSSIHLRFGDNENLDGTGFQERGRIRFGTTGNEAGAGISNVNYMQSGVNYSGTLFNDFAIGPYSSSDWWQYFDASTGFVGINTDTPEARLHVFSGGSYPVLIDSSANTCKVGFRGTNQTLTNTASVGIDSSGRLVLRGMDTDVAKVHSDGLQAGSDNIYSMGTAAFRWSVVYAGTGAINTSDESEKQDISAIPDEWLDAWGDVEWSTYKWKAAVIAKGADARLHIGLIAQRVRDAFAAHRIDAFEIGLLCKDQWTDAGGVQHERYGLRYDEAFALEAAWTRREINTIKGAIQ